MEEEKREQTTQTIFYDCGARSNELATSFSLYGRENEKKKT